MSYNPDETILVIDMPWIVAYGNTEHVLVYRSPAVQDDSPIYQPVWVWARTMPWRVGCHPYASDSPCQALIAAKPSPSRPHHLWNEVKPPVLTRRHPTASKTIRS